MLYWINSYLPPESVDVEILKPDNQIVVSSIEFVYDSDRDPNDNSPKWWCEENKQNIELRDVIAWRHITKEDL